MANNSVLFCGYSSIVKITIDSTTMSILCSSFSVNFSQKTINSSGIFAAGVADVNSAYHFNSAYRIDVPSISFNLTFDATSSVLGKMKDILTTKRSNKIGIAVNGNKFDCCYWTSITLTAAQHAAFQVSMNLIQIGSSYSTAYAKGFNSSSSGSETISTLPDLIPYYATTVADSTSKFQIIDWSVQFSQDIVDRTFCLATTTSVAPSSTYFTIGPQKASLKINQLLTTSSIDAQSLINNVSISSSTFGFSTQTAELKYKSGSTDTSIVKLQGLQLKSAVPKVLQWSNFISIQLTYESYQIDKTASS